MLLLLLLLLLLPPMLVWRAGIPASKRWMVGRIYGELPGACLCV
jgi:hypothetical protein